MPVNIFGFSLLTLSVIIGSLQFVKAGLATPRSDLVHNSEELARRGSHRPEVIEVITTCKKKGTFALTYDDGPYIYENQISDYLSDHNAKATFFVNGLNYGCIYDEENVKQLKRTFYQGHAIGSHTWSHANITTLNEAELTRELHLLEIAFKKILGIKTKLFRPPYGAINDRAKAVLNKRGYSIVTWSFDSGDSVGASPLESTTQYSQMSHRFPSPQIALNHETHGLTATKVTPKAVEVLKRAGYKLVTVPECLGWDHYYERVGKPQARDSSWTCA